jgi:hypothetical protein
MPSVNAGTGKRPDLGHIKQALQQMPAPDKRQWPQIDPVTVQEIEGTRGELVPVGQAI